MPKILSTVPTIAALVLASALHAQEDTGAQTAEDAGTAQAEDAADIGQDLNLGREIDDDPTYIKETYDAWQLKCFRNEGTEEDVCQMYQLLTEDAGNPVAEFSIFRLAEGAQAVAGATIVVPLGTLLSEELKIAVDGGRAKSYPFSFCTMAGCFARIGFTEADIEAFRRGQMAQLAIVPAQAPDQTVDIGASLAGFTAAYNNVSTLDN